MPRRSALALTALSVILAVTAAWWALALWPAAGAPDWVERTRAVCFGAAPGGLPNAGGWILLIGEPLGMLAVLMIVWGDDVRAGLRALGASPFGRGALGIAVALLLLGAGAAMTRVRAASASVVFAPSDAAASRRLDRPAPPLALLAQSGDTVRLEQLRGRPVLVAFAYAHCATVCPVIVRDAIAALEHAAEVRPALLVVTLDPWRDTPSRLPAIAASWELPDDAHVLSGGVEAVERTLDAWGIARDRDERTGEIVHPTSVFIVDARGRLAFVASGDARALAALLRTA
jgi:protein SCO1/2